MASKRIDISINGSANAGNAMKTTSQQIKKLMKEAEKPAKVNIDNKNAGNAVKTTSQQVKQLMKEAEKPGKVNIDNKSAQTSLKSVESQAKLTMKEAEKPSKVNIDNKSAQTSLKSVESQAKSTAKSVQSSFSSMGSAIGSVFASIAGGFGLMELAQSMWSGATQKQFNEVYLGTKMNTAAAKSYIKTIQQIVAEVPGDDTFMNSLLTGALAKQTNLSVETLRLLGQTAADYVLVSQQTGAGFALESQREIKDYILTGNTGLMARDGILRNQLKTLEGKKTIQERILALDKALKDEGYRGLSQQEIAAVKMEEFKGKLQVAATTVGEKLLPYVERVLDWFLGLDNATQEWITQLGVVVGIITGLGLLFAPVIWSIKEVGDGILDVTKKIKGLGGKKKIDFDCNPCPAGSQVGGGKSKNKDGGMLPSWLKFAGAAAIIASASAGAGAALASLNNALGGTYDQLKGLLSLMPPGTSGAGVIGAVLTGEEGGLIDALMGSIPFLGSIYLSMTSFWGQVSSLTGVNINSIKNAFASAGAYIIGAWNNTVGAVVGAYNWMKSVVGSWIYTGINVATGALDWARQKYQQARAIIGSWIHTGISIATGAIDWARARYNDLRNYIMNNPIVQTIRQVVGMGPGGARGPRGPEGIHYSYQNYAGHQKDNVWNSTGSCLTGNCVDMTLGLIGRYGGSMISGTWNGGPHVWWQAPDGSQFDPARMALNGIGTPPPRGPGDGSNVQVVNMNYTIQMNGNAYNTDDFDKMMEDSFVKATKSSRGQNAINKSIGQIGSNYRMNRG